jgi:hypothetical protein
LVRHDCGFGDGLVGAGGFALGGRSTAEPRQARQDAAQRQEEESEKDGCWSKQSGKVSESNYKESTPQLLSLATYE